MSCLDLSDRDVKIYFLFLISILSPHLGNGNHSLCGLKASLLATNKGCDSRDLPVLALLPRSHCTRDKLLSQMHGADPNEDTSRRNTERGPGGNDDHQKGRDIILPEGVLDRIFSRYYPQPTKSKFAIVDKKLRGLLRDPALVFFHKFGDLTLAQQQSALALGWTAEQWPGGPAKVRWQRKAFAQWGSVDPTEREHWKILGFSESTWALFGQERYNSTADRWCFWSQKHWSGRRYRIFGRWRCSMCTSYYWEESGEYTPRCYCGVFAYFPVA